MRIGIGKIGKSVLFNSKNWGAVGGDNEAPILYEHLITQNPEHTFVMLGASDFDRLSIAEQERINVHGNFIYAFSGFSEWRKNQWDKSKAQHPSNDRQEFMENIIIPNPKFEIDAGVFMCGQVATSNVGGWARKQTDHTQLAKPLDVQRKYAGPTIHYLNKYKEVPWLMLLNDPRLYPGKMRDLMNPPRKIFSQYNQKCLHRNSIEYDSPVREITEIEQLYKGIETTFLIGKEKGKSIQEAPNTLDSFFGEPEEKTTEKDINFMIVCNEGKPSRYPDLKKYILEHVDDVDIYGQWNSDTIGDDSRFKGPKKFNDLMTMLPRVKYTFCIPIKKGWVTAKFWEMAHYGIIPFLHPTYDQQKHLDVPDFIRVKDSKDLFNKIKFLEENPKAYQQLRDQLDDILKEEYYDGSYLNDLILGKLTELNKSNA